MAEESRTLQIVLQARDEASRVIKQVGDSASDLGTSIRDKLKENVVALGGAFAATSAIVGTSIAAFAESENVTTLLETAIRSTGGAAGVTAVEVLSLSAALQQQSRFSDEAITSAQTLLIRFGNIGKDILPTATKATLDLAQGMGIDLQSAAQSVGIALSQPAEGIGRLSRSIPAFKGEIGDMIKSLAESGKTMEAQKLILGTLSTGFGDTALKSAQTFSGGIDQLKNNINDLQETIGKELVVTLGNLTGGFDNANKAVVNLNAFLKEHHDILLGLVVALGVVTIGFGVLFVAALAAAAGVSLVFVGAVGAVLLAVGFLAGVIAVHFGAIMQLATQLKDNIVLAFQGILLSITETIAMVQETITTGFMNILTSFTNLFTLDIPFAVGFAIGFLSVAIPQMVMDMITAISTLPEQFLAMFQLIVTNIVERITFVANWLKTEIAAWPGRIQGFIASIPTIVGTIFETAKQAVLNKMREMFEDVEMWWNKIKGILEGIKNAAEAAISAVARGLEAGAKAGSRQFGGFVPTTGLALLHAGEFVVSRDMQAGRAPVSPSVANNFSQPITINATIQSEPDWDALGFRLAWILRNSR